MGNPSQFARACCGTEDAVFGPVGCTAAAGLAVPELAGYLAAAGDWFATNPAASYETADDPFASVERSFRISGRSVSLETLSDRIADSGLLA
jgi:hypothetical protein